MIVEGGMVSRVIGSQARPRAVLVATWIAILSGGAMIVATLAAHTFSRADAGERTTDLVRSELTQQGLARHRQDFEIIKAAVIELYDRALPAFAQRLGTSASLSGDRYPALAFLASTRDESLRFAEGIVSNLERHRSDFDRADAIPLGGLPLTAGPWFAVAFGSVLSLTGLSLALRPRRGALMIMGTLGLALIAGPFAVSFPQKANAAQNLLDTLNVTPELAARTRDIAESGRAAVDELERRLLPDLTAALEISREQLDVVIAQEFPSLAAARVQADDVLARYERRVRIREGGVPLIPEAKKFPLTTVVWWTLSIGLLTSIGAAAGLIRATPGALMKATEMRREAGGGGTAGPGS